MATPIEIRTLANGLKLEILDESRPVAGDRVQVRLCFRVSVNLQDPALCDALRSRSQSIEELIELVGTCPSFEKRLERNFIDIRQRADVMDALCASYTQSAGPYLGSSNFALSYLLREAQQARQRKRMQATLAKSEG